MPKYECFQIISRQAKPFTGPLQTSFVLVQILFSVVFQSNFKA